MCPLCKKHRSLFKARGAEGRWDRAEDLSSLLLRAAAFSCTRFVLPLGCVFFSVWGNGDAGKSDLSRHRPEPPLRHLSLSPAPLHPLRPPRSSLGSPRTAVCAPGADPQTLRSTAQGKTQTAASLGRPACGDTSPLSGSHGAVCGSPWAGHGRLSRTPLCSAHRHICGPSRACARQRSGSPYTRVRAPRSHQITQGWCTLDFFGFRRV